MKFRNIASLLLISAVLLAAGMPAAAAGQSGSGFAVFFNAVCPQAASKAVPGTGGECFSEAGKTAPAVASGRSFEAGIGVTGTDAAFYIPAPASLMRDRTGGSSEDEISADESDGAAADEAGRNADEQAGSRNDSGNDDADSDKKDGGFSVKGSVTVEAGNRSDSGSNVDDGDPQSVSAAQTSARRDDPARVAIMSICAAMGIAMIAGCLFAYSASKR